MAKVEVLLPLIKLISKKKSSYIDTLDKKDLVFDIRDLTYIDKATKMPGKNKDTKILDIRYILLESKYITFSQSKLEIQSI